MIPAVDVVDDTGLVGDHEAVKGLVRAVLEEEGIGGRVEVAFVGEGVITELNERFRDADGPTDVLSFDYSAEAEWPGEPEAGEVAAFPAAAGGAYPGEEGRRVAGEMILCPRVVARFRPRKGGCGRAAGLGPHPRGASPGRLRS